MPPLTASPPYTSLDVQDQMIAYLNADPQIRAIVRNSEDTFNPVLDDDPKPGAITQGENTRLVFTLAAEGEEDATLGASNGGTADVINCYAVMLYVFDGPNRTPAGKRTIVRNTSIVRQALMRHRQGVAVLAGQTTNTQLWWISRFRKQGKDVTIYTTPAGSCRLSITLIELTSRIPFT